MPLGVIQHKLMGKPSFPMSRHDYLAARPFLYFICVLDVAGWQLSESIPPDRRLTIKSLLDISFEVGLKALALDGARI